MPFIDMRADHRQSQTLSPRLQHAVRLLQMSSLDFAAMVRDMAPAVPFGGGRPRTIRAGAGGVKG